MSDASAAVTAIKARIEAQTTVWPQGLGVHHGTPPDDAVTPYVCIWDQTGRTVRGKYVGAVQKTYWPFQLSCVGRTREGALDVADVARSVLDWAPVVGASRIVEDGSNPVLSEGTGSDVRYTAALTMHCYLP